jgi:hypothetical protein
MNTQQQMEDRLWEYIDGACTAEEKQFIDQLIATNQEWRAKYNELLEVHALMRDHLELDEPSMRFTQNVMEEIGKYQIAPAAKSYINKRIIWGIGSFFLLTIFGLLVYIFAQINWSATSAGSNDSVPFNLDKLDFSKIYNSTYGNIFMMVNVVLGLMLLDMYLGRKKKKIISNNE